MVGLPLSTKQEIVRLIANGQTQTSVATTVKTSSRTVRRVLQEHRDGLFELPKAKKVTKPEIEIDIEEKLDEAINELSYVITPLNVCFTYKGDGHSVDCTAPNYDNIIKHLLVGDGGAALALIDVAASIREYMQGYVKISGGIVTYKDLEISGGMTGRIIDAMTEGDNQKVVHLVNFFENLMENPSNRAVIELFGFLEASDIELTSDGHFIAYKKVNSKYFDIRTNSMDNSPGMSVFVPRNQVDEDSNNTCSYGLHVCAKSYLSSYGSCGGNKVISCKVNPRDVVAVPRDYNNAKMRCAGYDVLKDVTAKV